MSDQAFMPKVQRAAIGNLSTSVSRVRQWWKRFNVLLKRCIDTYIHTYMYIFNLQRIQLTVGVLNVYYCYLFICICLVFLILAILMQRHRNPASSLLNTSLYPLINQMGAWQCFRSHSHREIQQQVCDHHKSAESVRHLLLITVAESRNLSTQSVIQTFLSIFIWFFLILIFHWLVG